jgi:hypothetical protein
MAANMLSMDRFPDQSQINELLRRMTSENVEELREVHRDLFIKHSLILSEPRRIIVDIDQTGLTAEGETFELTEKGYFPERRGTKGYKLSAAYVGGDSSEVLSAYLDPGDVHCISRFDDLFEDIKLCLKGISPDSQVVIRADSGYGSKDSINKLLQSGYSFVVKGYSSETSKNLACQLSWDDWEEVKPGVHTAEYTRAHAYGKARVVVYAIFKQDGELKFSHLITNIPATELDGTELFDLYNGRQSIEAFFKSCKQSYNIKNLRTRTFNGIYAFLLTVFITHNLVSLARRILFAGTELATTAVHTLVEKIGSISAKVERLKSELRLYGQVRTN